MSSNISWNSFCGNRDDRDLFWNSKLTIYTDVPELTRCFNVTVLAWIPCAWLWLSVPVYFVLLRHETSLHTWRSTSRTNRSKTVLCALLVLIASLDLWKSISEARHGVAPPSAYFVTPAITTATMILACVWTPYEYIKGVHSGPVMFLFWLLVLVMQIFPLRSYLLMSQRVGGMRDEFRGSTCIVQFCLVFVTFLLHLWSDDDAHYPHTRLPKEKAPLLKAPEDKKQDTKLDTSNKISPMFTASYLSRILYIWITGLIVKGYRKTLLFSDLTQLLPWDTSKSIVPAFESLWQEQIGKDISRQENKRPKSLELKPHKSEDRNTSVNSENKASIYSVITVLFGPYYGLCAAYKLGYDLLAFLCPPLLSTLITFIGSDSDRLWHGYFLAGMLFLVCVLRTVVGQAYWNSSYVTGMRLRTGVIGAIYRKSLRLNNTSRRSATVGEIVNLMSVDAQNLQDAPTFLHMLWSAPVTIAIALYFLWMELGPSCMAGFGLLVLMVPVNSYIGAVNRKLQVEQMDLKDLRIKVLSEILGGIKVVKMYSWESPFRDKILNIRNRENDLLKRIGYNLAISNLSWRMSPYLVSLGAFAVYVLISPENVLTPNNAFVSLALFNIMNYPLAILPTVIAYTVQTIVSLNRIEKFLKSEELDPRNVHVDRSAAQGITIKNGTFTWGEDVPPVLSSINLTVKRGGLTAVVGGVGSGKSSLISAMLGELEVFHGSTTLSGSVAYVPQQAWIQHATLKDNILFYKTLDQRRYQKIIDACALAPDLKMLTGGDLTEIGEKGINLSGGQKQRVSIARAVYADSDIYLLDDPLSAVDSHVGKHIFDRVIGPQGLLKKKTRVLVTNSLGYLPRVDNIIVLENGEIAEMGTFEELVSNQQRFAGLVHAYLRETEDQEGLDKEMAEQNAFLRQSLSSGTDTGASTDTDAGYDSGKSRKVRRRKTGTRSRKSLDMVPEENSGLQLTEEEYQETGSIGAHVLKAYVQACGTWRVILTAVCYTLFMGTQVGTNIWLSEWTSDPVANGSQIMELRDLRLGVYGAFGVIQGLVVLVQSLMIAIGCVEAARCLHGRLLNEIMRAPMSFFDTTPLGRLINRFSKDIDTLDVNMPLTIRILAAMIVTSLQTVIVVSYSTPIFLALAIPLTVIYWLVQRCYIRSSRQLKRIESVRRSPIFAHFGETVVGMSSIRAYRMQNQFVDLSDRYVDENQMAYFPNIMSNRWMGLHLENVGNVVVLLSGILAVYGKDNISGGDVGLSVTYALQITYSLNLLVRMMCDMETYIVSVERIEEYMGCPKEAPGEIPDNRPPPNWPEKGVVEFKEYMTRYRPGLDLVLKGVSCQIKSGEKVAVVGRTGAGKSSLTLALFRIIEAAGGSIVVDDVHISRMGLNDLRSKFTVIPQDPVIFSGSLRMNLDPFGKHSDVEMWAALKQSHLEMFVQSLPQGLDYECSEGGENLSVGQRQLVCLARALLRRTKILVLDEATAAIDLVTDDLIQNTIRTEFKECTIVTIAHRLNTVMDYDRIMVLDKGEIVEYDSPSVLLQDRAGHFYRMARDAGLV